MNEKPTVSIDKEKCIGCGICAKDCVAKAITIVAGKANVKSECLYCGHCLAVCPCGAVSIPEYDMEEVETYNKDTFHVNPEQLLRSIKYRRSIRDYKPMPVEEEKLNQILQAGRYTATAKNNQDCTFVFVQKELDVLKDKVWGFIDDIEKNKKEKKIPREVLPYISFNRQRKKNPEEDYLFRNAPVVMFVASQWPLDAGLASQNMENMANAQGLGVLFDGYLASIADINEELKTWLGIEGKEIRSCMLLGYPNVKYQRTTPKRKAKVIWK